VVGFAKGREEKSMDIFFVIYVFGGGTLAGSFIVGSTKRGGEDVGKNQTRDSKLYCSH
jgi:hypothetical protein